MSYTFPDSFNEDISSTEIDPNYSNQLAYQDRKNNQKKKVEDMLSFRNQVDKLEDLRANKNSVALLVSAVSGFLLLMIGGQFASLNIIVAFILALILIPIFVTSSLFVSVLKTSRNVIWFLMITVLLSSIIYSLINLTLFNGILFITLVLIMFLIFVAFLEVENSMRASRIFLINQITYQAKKLLLFTALLLISLGAFLSVSRVGGQEFIEKNIENKVIYNNLFDPAKKGAVFGQPLVNSTTLQQIAGKKDQPAQNYYSLLLIKKQENSKDKEEFLGEFSLVNPGCKTSAIQVDNDCKKAFEDFSKTYLANFSKKEFGINVSDPKSSITLDTSMTPDAIKTFIIKAYGNYYVSSFESRTEASQRNPIKDLTIIGKKDALALIIALIIFFLLVLFLIPLNLITSLITKAVWSLLLSRGIITIDVVSDEVEVLSF
jgi:hypothetical protein